MFYQSMVDNVIVKMSHRKATKYPLLNLKLNVWFQGEQTLTKIENVIGVIEGVEEPDRCVGISLIRNLA